MSTHDADAAREKEVMDQLRYMLNQDPGCADNLLDNISQTTTRDAWKGRMLAVVGGEVLKKRPDLGDRFFELFGDRLTPGDLERILSYQDGTITGSLAFLLLRESNKHSDASNDMVENLLAHILLEGACARDEDLLDATLGEVDISERTFRGLRGEGNALYLAADLMMLGNTSADTPAFVFKRLVAAGCELEIPCRHEVRRKQYFDFHSPLAMACACLDAGKEGAKRSIDGLLEAGADPSPLRRLPGAAAEYLRSHPKVRAKRMKAALGWVGGRSRKTIKADRPWRGL